MKKTIISICMLGLIGVPHHYYGYSQGSILQKSVIYEVPITKIFEKLSQSTSTKFFYSDTDFRGITVDESKINYKSVEAAMQFLAKHYPLQFISKNNTIIVRKVVSASNISQPSASAKLPTENFGIVSKRDTIRPNEKETALEEVVLVGYGKQSKKDITGSIASVDEKQMKGMASSNLGDAMAGKVTGVQVLSTGSPGSSPNIRIRGVGTLTAGSSPLIVVDGFPLAEGTNMNAIDPNSIAKMDILKDAASAAIYGSRGANGVILIETKQGRSGRMDVSFDTYYGVQTRSDNVKYVDAYEMAIFLKEARDNNYLSKGPNRSINDDTATRKAKGATLRELIPDYLIPYLEKQPGLINTDWLNTVMRPAPMSQYSVTIRGGSDKSKFSVTGTYFKQDGLVIGTNYEKMSTSINLDSKLGNNIRFGLSLMPSYQTAANLRDNGRTYNPLQMASISYPFFAPRDATGNPIVSEQIRVNTPTDGALVENPVAMIELTKSRNENMKTFGNFYTEATMLKDFKYKFSLGGDYQSYEYNFFDPSTVGAYRAPAPDVTIATRTSSVRKNYLVENLLTYNKKIGAHNVNAIFGQSYQNQTFSETTIDATGFPDNSITNIAGGTSFKNDLNEYEWSLISYFTRANYNYSNRYNLMASYRRDGSSRFGANSKWGDFYALAVAWNLSNEAFFPKNKTIDNIKLRYSIGTNGNNQIPNYGSLSLMAESNYLFNGGLAPGYRSSSAPNPNISWEKSKSNNFGVDFTLFNRFLNLAADYYIINRDGLLLDVPVPEQSGYSTSLQNIGKIENKGFELQLSTIPLRIGENFTYSNNLSFSTNKNKVLALGAGQDQIITGTNNFSVTKVGGSIGQMYGYNITGVYKTQAEIDATPHITGTLVGDYIMEDLNKDGIIDGNDKKSFGTGSPKYIFGFTNNLQFKNFELAAMFYSELGKRVYNGDAVSTLDSGEGFGMASKEYFDNRYHPINNPNGIYGMPNMNFSNNRKEARTSNLFFKKGDYIRLRSLKLGYNLPESMTSVAKLRSAQLYLLGNNVFTITNYKGQNLDPRVDNVLIQGFDNGYYPVTRTFSMGLTVNF